jgi:enterochelin esterase-like enzyme
MKAALAVVLLAAAPAAGEVRYASFASPSLGREVAYAVDLPASYAEGRQSYPALYVLHGLFESHAFWERRGLAAILAGLREKRELPEFLVVAVDGGNSFFVNGRAGRFEDLAGRDIVEHVEATYRVARGRVGRMLLGVSMGGYAALRIALKRPELFGAVAAHSAMLLQRIPAAEDGAGRWHMEAFRRAFGDPIDPALWAASDPLALAAHADPAAAPALSFDCGAQDHFGLAEGNRALHRLLESRGVAHEFALPPGDHGYEYVRTVLPASLRFLARSRASGRPVGLPAPWMGRPREAGVP